MAKIKLSPCRYHVMYPFFLSMSAMFIVTGFLFSSPKKIVSGLVRIILTEDALISDYIFIAGLGPALVNSGIVSLISLLLLRATHAPFNGMTAVVMGLMSGFSLFGKNFVNIWPIIFGTWLYARWKKEPFGRHLPIALMATALSPMVSYIALDNGFGNPIYGLLVGMIIGFLMPDLSQYTYKIQNGVNLYNCGFSCGLLAFIFVPLIQSLGGEPAVYYRWASGQNLLLGTMLLVYCLALIVGGLFFAGTPVWAAWAGYHRLLLTSGRSPSDYVRMFGMAPVLINAGVNGLIGGTFILCIGGDLNGPTIGAILTIMGFSAFGKHALNIIPVMLGVALGGFLMHWSLSDPAVQLTCLFCTTLAPIAGYFGWQYGILAGFLHSSVVLFTGSAAAGLNLYNNGFSGGLVAIVLYPIITSIARKRIPTLQEYDYLDMLEDENPIMPPERHQYSEEKEL